MNYRALFDIPNDFLRSTRIDLDTQITNYFVYTPMFERLLVKVLEGLNGGGPRAITVTGPYGSGKSTAILEIVKLLQFPDSGHLQSLKQQYNDMDLTFAIPKTIILSLVGTTGLIAPVLLNALVNWATLNNDHELIHFLTQTNPLDLTSMIDALDIFRKKNNGHALIIIIDELGKHLEYAVSHPEDNDIYLLQLIAEYASRSTNPAMSFITILHQAFENYGHRLLKSQRNELTKIQGRFEDIPFQLPVEDTLRVIGAAVSSTCLDQSALTPAANYAEKIGSQLYDKGIIRSNLITKNDYLYLCRQCAPLHPITALLLGPLFRYFAQNERSLFSLLYSYESHGFQRFLEDTEFNTDSPKLYSLADLYEYVITSIGSSVYSSSLAHRWRIIENHLGRIPDDHQLAGNIIRTIGLISSIPINQLVASENILELTLQDNINDELQYLIDRSLMVYRRFSDSYRLWDGSDINIEARLEVARQTIGLPTLDKSLTELTPPKPITARRHLMQTGALRWFETRYSSVNLLDGLLNDDKPLHADGRVYFVIASSEDKLPVTLDWIQSWQLVIWISLPSDFIQTIAELSYVRWVRENTPELINDEVARREVSERESNLEQIIQNKLNRNMFLLNNEITFFTHRKTAEHIAGNKLNAIISDLCDNLYPQAPRIINEFVNRNKLSSAAAAARNEVVKRMIDYSDKEMLGIVGYPPALPIYLSTLRETKLHREVHDRWSLNAPPINSPWFHAWNKMRSLSTIGYRSVAEIWETLSSPPYGIRNGLLPILTVAFINVHRGQISIIEDGEFLPELTSDKIELFLRMPERFRIHLTEIRGNQKLFLESLVNKKVIPNVEWDTSVNLLSLVSPLVRFGRRLPEFTRNTKTLSETAYNVRQAIVNAKEPADLLFNDLPKSAGYESVTTEDDFPVEEITAKIVTAVQELNSTYERLKREIGLIIFNTFGFESIAPKEALRNLRRRASLVQDVVQNLELKATAWRMSQDLEIDAWIESVASVIMKKPPNSWLDRDIDDFRLKVFLVEREFMHFETIATIYSKESNETPIRIGITTLNLDFETVVNVSEHQEKRSRSIVEELLEKLKEKSIGHNELLFIATELVKNYLNTSPLEKERLHV